MNPLHENWVAKTVARRGALGAPFSTGLVPDGCADPQRAWQAAAVAALHVVAARPVSVGFAAGASFADLEHDAVNLDLEGAQAGDDAWACERSIAMAVHEAAHVLLSRQRPEGEPPVFAWIHNLIEDERIECALPRLYPVFAHPLAQLRRDVLRVARAPADPLACLFVLVRAPERLASPAWRHSEAFLRKVIGILEPFPRTPGAVTRAAREIVALLPPALRDAELPGHLLARSCTRAHGHPGAATPWPRRRRPDHRGAWSGGAGEVARFPRITWSEAPRDPAGYERVRREVQSEAAWLAERIRALLPRRRDERARSGVLDRRRLHAFRYDDRLFRASGRRTQRLVLAVIIDLSGSMRGACEAIAQRMAVTLAEATLLLPGVRLHVYGHTADLEDGPSTDLVRFTASSGARFHGLGTLPIGRNNRDAHAFEAIGHDLLWREGPRRGPRAAIVLFDGLPDAKGFSGEAALRATRHSIGWLEKVWGPTALLSTKDVPTLDRIARVTPCHADPERPGRALAKMLAIALARS